MAMKRFLGREEEELCEQYLAGATVDQLAAKYETERITVSRTLKRNGITPRGAQGRKPRYLTDAEEDEIVRRYGGGDTITSMSGDYGTHYSRIAAVLRQRGVHLRPRSWKGGWTTTPRGYLMVMVDDGDTIGWPMANSSGYVMLHRLTMAQHLGRPLTPSETVHHVNGDKSDNRIENLQLRTGPHGVGTVLICGDCGSHNISPEALADG